MGRYRSVFGQKCCGGTVVRMRELPGDPVVKTLNFRCRDAGCVGLSPGWGTKIPCAGLLCGVTGKKVRNKGGGLKFSDADHAPSQIKMKHCYTKC